MNTMLEAIRNEIGIAPHDLEQMFGPDLIREAFARGWVYLHPNEKRVRLTQRGYQALGKGAA